MTKLPTNSIIASGPVIIEDNKVLLNREQKPDGLSFWMFPGGEVEAFDVSLEEACKRETKEEMGIEVEIIKPLTPMILQKEERIIVLIHFLAKRLGEIKPGQETADWGWHDINNLPDNCAPNVYEIIKSL